MSGTINTPKQDPALVVTPAAGRATWFIGSGGQPAVRQDDGSLLTVPGASLPTVAGEVAVFADANGNLKDGNGANAMIALPDTGAVISRDVADANPALVVSQGNAASTGDVLQLRNSGGTVFSVSQGGALTLLDGAVVTVGSAAGTCIGSAGGAGGQKLAFFGAVPVVQPLLATGASHSVDEVIAVLQALGLCRQS